MHQHGVRHARCLSLPTMLPSSVIMPVNIWDEIRSRIQGKVNRVSYNTWFLPTVFVADDDCSVTVSVPNTLFRDWITKHYSSVIADALQEMRRPHVLISFVMGGSPDLGSSPHSVDERFDRIDQELAVIKRDVELIVEKLSSTQAVVRRRRETRKAFHPKALRQR